MYMNFTRFEVNKQHEHMLGLISKAKMLQLDYVTKIYITIQIIDFLPINITLYIYNINVN